jgi:4-amino-4-deoxy-L-arabinose transferase-like glycosyltransferase
MPANDSRSLPDLAPALILGGLTALLHLLTASDGWDLFRDELYYLANSHHIAFGYVDHPPLIGWLTWVARTLFGTSQLGLRCLPALAAGATAFTVCRIAAALGGGLWSQLLAGAATAFAPLYIALFGYLSMNSFDILFWAICLWILVRLLASRDLRWWLPFGLVAGLGLENKISILFLGVGVVAGLLAARDWASLRSRWLWLGGAAAVLLFAPYLLWQVAHGWPTLEFIRNATEHKIQPLSPLAFLGFQVEAMGMPAAALALVGWIFLFAGRPTRAHRALAWTPLAVLALLVLQRSKPYYFAPAWSLLFAAGGAGFAWWTDRRGWRLLRPVALVLIVAFGLAAAPLVKPVLDVEGTVAYMRKVGAEAGTDERKEVGRLGQMFADRLGWRSLATTVARVSAGLSTEERAKACVFAQNYGQAGAIEHYGRDLSVPPVIGGHNSYALWGPGSCTGEVVIVVDGDRDRLGEEFDSVEHAATYTCADCMPYESSKEIWLARGLRAPIDQVWGSVRHFD